MNQHDNFTRNCSCTVACTETDFSAIVTTSTWPSNQYWVSLINDNISDELFTGGNGCRISVW